MSYSDGTIRFFIDGGDMDAVVTRLRVSMGVMRAEHSPLRDQYEATAFTPAMPWRSLQTRDLVALTTVERLADPGSWVTIVRLPNEVREAVDGAGFAQTDAPTEATAAALRAEGRAALRAVEEYARRHLVRAGGFTMLAFGVHGPGLLTTTRNPATGRFIGLHLDAWDGPPLSNPGQARRNRFVANLGGEDRYLFYVPVALNAVARAFDGPWNVQTAHVETAYLEQNLTQVIVRLRVAPGEAYIAPTDEMIHDGSTVGQTKQDITVTYLGHFAPMLTPANHEVPDGDAALDVAHQ